VVERRGCRPWLLTAPYCEELSVTKQLDVGSAVAVGDLRWLTSD